MVRTSSARRTLIPLQRPRRPGCHRAVDIPPPGPAPRLFWAPRPATPARRRSGRSECGECPCQPAAGPRCPTFARMSCRRVIAPPRPAAETARHGNDCQRAGRPDAGRLVQRPGHGFGQDARPGRCARGSCRQAAPVASPPAYRPAAITGRGTGSAGPRRRTRTRGRPGSGDRRAGAWPRRTMRRRDAASHGARLGRIRAEGFVRSTADDAFCRQEYRTQFPAAAARTAAGPGAASQSSSAC